MLKRLPYSSIRSRWGLLRELRQARVNNHRWNRLLIILGALGLGLGFLGSEAQAVTYFVDPEEGNDTNSGLAMNSAWAHLPGSAGFTGLGWRVLLDGDTILVKGGSINNVQVKFTPAYYAGSARFDSITVQSGHLAEPQWGTSPAVISGQNSRTYGVWFIGNSAGPLSGVTFDGFEVRNIAPGAVPGFDSYNGSSCLLIGSSSPVNRPAAYVTIKRCWLHDAQRNGEDRGHGIEFNGSSHWIVTQNRIGPEIGTKGCEPFAASHGVISNNFISGTGDHCISLTRATNVDVCNNVIFNIPPQVHDPQFGISMSQAAFCDVWNNLIYRPRNILNAAHESWSQALGMYTTCVSNRIAYNTMAHFGNYLNGGMSTMVSLYEPRTPNTNVGTLFQNNILYKAFNVAGPIQYYVCTTTVGAETVKYNNFFSSLCIANIMSYHDGTGAFYGSASSFNPGEGHTYTDNLQLDPLFTGGVLPSGLDANYRPNSPYFRPTVAASVLIRKTQNPLFGDGLHGYSAEPGKFGTDIVGTRRSGWSMGAYEVSQTIPAVPVGLRLTSGQ